jgi:hypothetical protein
MLPKDRKLRSIEWYQKANVQISWDYLFKYIWPQFHWPFFPLQSNKLRLRSEVKIAEIFYSSSG